MVVVVVVNRLITTRKTHSLEFTTLCPVDLTGV